MANEREKFRKAFPILAIFVQIVCRIGFVLSFFFLLTGTGNPYLIGAILVLMLGGAIATLPADNNR